MKAKDSIASCQSEDEKIQNQFTSYLCKAIRGTRQRYLIQSQTKEQPWEELDDKLISRSVTENVEDEVQVTDRNLEDMICNSGLLLGILKLSERERKVLYLHTICHLKHGEIADFLGLKEPTIKLCYSKLIRKLRASLEVDLREGV